MVLFWYQIFNLYKIFNVLQFSLDFLFAGSFQITYFLIKWLYQKKYKELEWSRHEYWNVTFGFNWRLCRSFFYTLYLYQSSIHHYMEDLSPGCKRHPDYEIAVSFTILIPNKNTGVMLRHSSSLFYYFLSLFVRLHITIATITRIIPNISPASLYPKRMITQQALLRNHPWNTVFTIIQICRAVQPKSDWIFYYI